MIRHLKKSPMIGVTAGALLYHGEGHARGKVLITVEEDMKKER
jgi:hypothetical protein